MMIPEKWNDVKDIILLGIRPKRNDTVYTEDYLDLQVYMYFPVDGGVVKVNLPLLNYWKVTVEEAMIHAKANTVKTLHVESMKELIERLMGITQQDDVPDQVVIKNDDDMFGAIALYFPDILKLAADKSKAKEIYILPSSIHEVIVVPSNMMTVTEATKMITTINETEVDEKDRLANHPYIYNVFTNTVKEGR